MDEKSLPPDASDVRLFPRLDGAVGAPGVSEYTSFSLDSVYDGVLKLTLEAGDPLFYPEIEALHAECAAERVRLLCREAPGAARLDDRAATAEVERLDQARYRCEAERDDARSEAAHASAEADAAEARVHGRPWVIRLWLLLFWPLTAVAMTAFMYETFVGIKAANAEAAASLPGGGSGWISAFGPEDLALWSCFVVALLVTGLVTGLAASGVALGAVGKTVVVGLEAGLAVTLYWMRSSGHDGSDAASLAYAAAELVVSVLHGVVALKLSGRLVALLTANRERDRARAEQNRLQGVAAERQSAWDKADAEWRKQLEWYTRIVDQLAWQAHLQKLAADTAKLAYRHGLQRLAGRYVEPVEPRPAPSLETTSPEDLR